MGRGLAEGVSLEVHADPQGGEVGSLWRWEGPEEVDVRSDHRSQSAWKALLQDTSIRRASPSFQKDWQPSQSPHAVAQIQALLRVKKWQARQPIHKVIGRSHNNPQREPCGWHPDSHNGRRSLRGLLPGNASQLPVPNTTGQTR